MLQEDDHNSRKFKTHGLTPGSRYGFKNPLGFQNPNFMVSWDMIATWSGTGRGNKNRRKLHKRLAVKFWTVEF